MDLFIRAVGIYPAGRNIQLRNGRKAYVIDSDGPIVIPFASRVEMPFSVMQYPPDLKEAESSDPELGIDRRVVPASPAETYELLPHYLKAPIRLVSTG